MKIFGGHTGPPKTVIRSSDNAISGRCPEIRGVLILIGIAEVPDDSHVLHIVCARVITLHWLHVL